VVHWLSGFEASVDKKLSSDFVVERAMNLKARDWHVGFDKTWFADAFKDWSGYRIVLVSVV
jgi:hypothetical protein